MHRKDFERRERRFVDGNAYTVTREEYEDEAEEWAARWIVHVHKEPPVERWGALIGECLFNYRSALDHLAYDLAVAHTGGPLSEARERTSEFPIFWRSAPSESDLNRRIGGVHPDARRLIESMQPYGRRDRAALKYVEVLSNFDKHRTLHLVIGVARGVAHFGEPPFDWVNFNPFVDGDVIAIGPADVDPVRDQNPYFAFGVAFSDSGPGNGYAVSTMLDWIGQHIEEGVIRPLLPYL